MVSPVILFSLIISIIASFQVFDLAYIMTDGGPGTETLFYVLYIFRNGFEFFRMGYASALAWVLFLLILGLTFLNFRASGRWVHYEVSAE
jgi:multiple sugar transport system permease protein